MDGVAATFRALPGPRSPPGRRSVEAGGAKGAAGGAAGGFVVAALGGDAPEVRGGEGGVFGGDLAGAFGVDAEDVLTDGADVGLVGPGDELVEGELVQPAEQ